MFCNLIETFTKEWTSKKHSNKSEKTNHKVSGGFFILEPSIFKYIKGDQTFFEREPLQKISKLKSLCAYKHHGFWQCMDTLRDKEILEKEIRKI